jgi:hypothetical protein
MSDGLIDTYGMGHGLAQAIRQYRRLCADPVSTSYNQHSAAVIVREAVEETKTFRAILESVAHSSTPVSRLHVQAALRDARDTNIATLLLRLTEYGLLARQWDHVPGRRGGKWLYSLSPLGRLVMGQKAGAV